MGLYLLLFFVFFLFACLDLTSLKKKAKLPLLIFLFIFIILLGGLRWKTGADWAPYYHYFTFFDANETFFRLAFEPGYFLLTYIVRLFSSNFTVFLLIFASLVNGLRIPFFYKYTSAVFLAFLLYWGNNLAEFGAVRQALAISVCLATIPCIVKKKWLTFMLLIIVAMQFHVTAIIFFLAYPIYHLQWGVRSKIFLLILSILLGFSGVISDALKVAADSLPGGLNRIAEKADDYSKMGADAVSGTNKSVALMTGIIKRALILPVMLYFEGSIKLKNSKYSKFMNLFVLGNIIYFIVADFLAVQRLASYFYPLEIILLCMIFEYSSRRIIWFIVFSSYAFVKFMFVLTANSNYFVPYFSIFSNDVFRAKGLNF